MPQPATITLLTLADDLRHSRVWRRELRLLQAARSVGVDPHVDIDLGVAFAPNDTTPADDDAPEVITIQAKARYTTTREQVKRPLLDYSVTATFAIDGPARRTQLDGDTMLIEPALASQLLTTTLGALRGMLALRTKGSALERHPLPLYNMRTLLDNLRGATITLRSGGK